MSHHLTTWSYTPKLQNNTSDRLSSGKKACENKGCDQPANHVVEDSKAIYFACDGCAPLIPDSKVIHSNPLP